MQEDPGQQPNINSWLEEELYSQYRTDKRTVDSSWGQVFENGGHTNGAPKNGYSTAAPSVEYQPMKALAAPAAPPAAARAFLEKRAPSFRGA